MSRPLPFHTQIERAETLADAGCFYLAARCVLDRDSAEWHKALDAYGAAMARFPEPVIEPLVMFS